MDPKWNKNFSLMLEIVVIQVVNEEDNLNVNAFAKQLVANGNVVRTKTADKLINFRQKLFLNKVQRSMKTFVPHTPIWYHHEPDGRSIMDRLATAHRTLFSLIILSCRFNASVVVNCRSRECLPCG